ncbi:MAG: beta-galactosidase, partial [bacterium]
PDTIGDLSYEPKTIAANDPVKVHFTASGNAKVELFDSLGRMLAREFTQTDGEQEVNLAAKPLVHSGFFRVTVGTASKQIPVRFAATTREWEDYEVILPWSGPGSYQPWIPALDEQFRRIGVTTLSRPERNFKIIASAHLRAFGIYWYRKADYEKRKAAFLETGDKSFITRDVSLHAPNFEEELKQQLQQRASQMLELKPFAYYLADESSLTAYADAFDVDWTPEALSGFRDWLREEYATLEELNNTWDTSFTNWRDVIPMTTDEVQKHGNFAPWSDHRVYMENEFIKAIATACRLTRELDPGGRASFSGTQIPALTMVATGTKLTRSLITFSPIQEAIRIQCIIYSIGTSF